jgi:hypothetical protein
MKKQKYNELKRNSKIPKGDKIKKELREKDKSKFLGHRPDLKIKIDFEISPVFKITEAETIKANRLRRANLKINQNTHPESYYADCYVNSDEYKSKRKQSI